MPQDLPPAGGYEPVQYKVPTYLPKSHQLTNRPSPRQRNLPARGFRPSYYLLAVGVIMSYGFYKVGKGIREQKYVDFSLSLLPDVHCSASSV